MENALLIIGFLFVVGSLGSMTKILSDISQTLQRIERDIGKSRSERA